MSLPPCFFRKASKPFSAGYFSLPMKTTGGVERRRRKGKNREDEKEGDEEEVKGDELVLEE